jgi:hypothetical protein
MQKKRWGRGKEKSDRFFLVTFVRRFIALFSFRAALTNSSLGSLLEMWRAKIQKWCSNSLSICSSYFLNVTVTLHKGRVIVALHPIKKRYHPILYSFFFPSLPFSQLFSSSLLSPLKKTFGQLLASSPNPLLNPPSHLYLHLPLKKTHLHKPIFWPFHKTQSVPISQNPTSIHSWVERRSRLGVERRSWVGFMWGLFM